MPEVDGQSSQSERCGTLNMSATAVTRSENIAQTAGKKKKLQHTEHGGRQRAPKVPEVEGQTSQIERCSTLNMGATGGTQSARS